MEQWRRSFPFEHVSTGTVSLGVVRMITHRTCWRSQQKRFHQPRRVERGRKVSEKLKLKLGRQLSLFEFSILLRHEKKCFSFSGQTFKANAKCQARDVTAFSKHIRSTRTISVSWKMSSHSLGILLINGSFVRLKGGMNVMKVLLERQKILF